MSLANERMGEVLVRIGLITDEDLANALIQQLSSGGRLGDVLVSSGVVTEEQIAAALAEQKHLQFMRLGSAPIDREVIHLLPVRFMQRKSIFPINIDNGRLVLAMSDPLDVEALDEAQIRTGYHVIPVVTTTSDITQAIESYVIGMDVVNQLEADFGDSQPATETTDAAAPEGDVPVVRMVNQVLRDAVREGASDVHFEPDQHAVRVRFRTDGVLRQVMTLPKGSHSGLVSRIKVMAEMDIAERRRPQDGRIAFPTPQGTVDLRVATIPTPPGEGVVIRILYRGAVVSALESLGLAARDLEAVTRMLSKPYGALLIAGPTGSGKTTTLYTALAHINCVERKIVTIEDPIEYTIDGLTQIAVNTRVGLSFAAGLRSVLRFDPDVVMVGEIRDAETASIAVRAALTGHYVLSSVHTNSAPAALVRLNEMGVEPYITSSALLGVVAQRLVRVLCRACKRMKEVPLDTLVAAGFSPEAAASVVTYEPVGCEACHNTGYSGRTGVFEVLELDDELAALAAKNVPADTLRDAAITKGMTTMRHDALARVAAGITSLDEVNRVVV